MWTCGTSQGLIHDVAPCADIVSRITADAERIISSLTDLVKD